MSNIVLERIKQQIPKSKKLDALSLSREIEIITRNIIPSEELKIIFMNELEPQIIEPIPDFTFNGIEEFSSWYLNHKSSFSDNQNIALSTVAQAYSVINLGCACKRKARLQQANEYFKMFWMNNKNTDLPSTILKIGKFNSVTFSVEGIAFFTFPTPQ